MSTEKAYKVKVTVAFIALFAFFLTAATVQAQQSSRDAYRTEAFSVSGNTDLEVETSGGSIQVYGSESGQVRVEMFVRRRGNFIDPGEANLENWDISIEKQGNKVYAVADRKENRRWTRNTYSISFVVYAPSNTEANIKTSGGSVRLEKLNGNQYARTSGGSMRALDINGDLDLKTSGGTIRIANIQGDVAAKTSGGSIGIEEANGNVDARTSGGTITVEGVEGNLIARTSGGSIRAKLDKLGEEINLSTSGGSIRVTVPRGSGLDVDLRGNRVNTELQNFSGSSKKRSLEGRLNGGGTLLRARTSGGSVTLNYQ